MVCTVYADFLVQTFFLNTYLNILQVILIVSILLLSLIVAVHQATRALRPEILKVLVILAALLREGLKKNH